MRVNRPVGISPVASWEAFVQNGYHLHLNRCQPDPGLDMTREAIEDSTIQFGGQVNKTEKSPHRGLITCNHVIDNVTWQNPPATAAALGGLCGRFKGRTEIQG
ncbi:uncharacterized protein PgNI_12507 [Pyricularia grisea]|uniref:Uncharacterized protein n=1 Tax=Pyricularia grisea TaxID=148305 RepID=A0A6P8AM87_PYRGI|nr:uncharacterized protein PgNI_12507 [Pyricularia grisea]TLD03141.1 hypothetical protein PgNI_12507 [Pyricularia grisea]